MVAISHLTGHPDLYDVVRRAVRDELAQIRADKYKRRAQAHARPRTQAQTAQDRLFHIIRGAKRYTRELRFDPAIARAGWMVHSKALKLSAMTAKAFAETMAELIGQGRVRMVGQDELEAIGVFKAHKVYCALNDAEHKDSSFSVPLFHPSSIGEKELKAP